MWDIKDHYFSIRNDTISLALTSQAPTSKLGWFLGHYPNPSFSQLRRLRKKNSEPARALVVTDKTQSWISRALCSPRWVWEDRKTTCPASPGSWRALGRHWADCGPCHWEAHFGFSRNSTHVSSPVPFSVCNSGKTLNLTEFQFLGPQSGIDFTHLPYKSITKNQTF